MDDLRQLYDGYNEYMAACESGGFEKLAYNEWVEQVAISALTKVSCLADEVAHYRQAAESNHDHYVEERRKREALETFMRTVSFLLLCKRWREARRLLAARVMWN